MQPAASNKHISLSMNFLYLKGMGYGFLAIGSPVVGTFILNRLVIPTFVDDLGTMLLNSFPLRRNVIPNFLQNLSVL